MSSAPILQPGQLVDLLPRGGQLLFCVASDDPALPRAILGSLAENLQRLKIVALALPGADQRAHGGAGSWQKLLRASAAGGTARRPLLFDFVTATPPGFRPSPPASRVLLGAAAGFRRRGVRAIWLLPGTFLTLDTRHRVFDVTVIAGGSSNEGYLQVLSAPGTYHAELFLPRPAHVDRDMYSISPPMAPVRPAPPSERRRRLEERVVFLEDRERAVFDASPHAQAMMTGTKFVRGNDALFRLFPWLRRPGDAEPTITEVFTRANSPGVKAVLDRVESGSPQGAVSATLRMRGGDRSERLVRLDAVPVPDNMRKLYLCTFIDLTEDHEAIRKAEKAERFYRSVAEDLPGAVCLEQDGSLVYGNRAFLEMFGILLREEAQGKELVSLVVPRDRKGAAQAMLPDPEDPGRTLTMQLTAVRMSGDRFPVQASVRRVETDSGTGSLWTWLDLSGRERAEQDMRRSVAEQEQIERVLSELHGSMSIKEVFDRGVRACTEHLGFESGAVFGLEPDAATLGIRASVNFPERLQLAFERQPLQEGLAGFLSKTHEVQILELAKFPPYLPHRSLFEGEKIRKVVLVPLLEREALAGMLMLCSTRPSDHLVLTPAHLRSVGSHFGSALENALLHDRLRASEELYRVAVCTVPDSLYAAEPSGRLVFVAPQIETLTGYRGQEFIRNPDLWRSIVHPDDRPEYGRRIASFGQGLHGVELEYRLLPKGRAGYRKVRDAVRYTLRDDGSLAAVHGIVSDITGRPGAPDTAVPSDEEGGGRNLAESLRDEVRESEETLRHVIDAMGDALTISDLDGKIWEANREFTDMTGYSREETLGIHFPYPWIVEEETARYVRWIGRLRERGTLSDFDMQWRKKEGVLVTVSLTTTMLQNARHEPVAMLHIARDLTDRKRREHELKALNTISGAIIHSRDLDQVLEVAAGQTKEIAGGHCVIVYLREGPSPRLSLAREDGVPKEVLRRVLEIEVAKRKGGGGGMGKEPLVIRPGKMADERMTPSVSDVYDALGLPAVAIVPLQSKGRLLGALLIGFNDEKKLSDDRQRVLRLIGNQLGPAIESVRLYREIQLQVERITLLYELGKEFTGALDPQSLFLHVYAGLVRALPVARLTYDVVLEDGAALRRVFAAPVPREDTTAGSQTTPLPESGPAARVLRSGRPFNGHDPEGHAVIAVPIRRGGITAGILGLERGSDEAYGPEHLRLLESIGTLIELSIERITLYDDTIAKAVELRQRNRELDDFAYVVSHDLKEPLIAIEGYSKILQSEFGQALNEAGTGYLSSVLQSTERAKNLIEDLLTLSRVGRAETVLRNVSVRDVVKEVLQDVEFTLRERNATVEVPDELPEVVYTRTELAMVFRNLIVNGVKFNERREPRVAVGVREDPGAFVFSVQDDGVGIDTKDFQRVFGVFQRLHAGDGYPGTGAGLTIVRKIVEAHGGRIWLESDLGEGSTFFFTVPKPEVLS